MSTIVLDDIPFRFNAEMFEKMTHINSSAPAGRHTARLIEQAVAAARPKAVYRVCYVDEHGDESIELEGTRFSSAALARNLAEVHRVFAYVATCGNELEQMQNTEQDALNQYALDGLKEMFLRTAVEYLKQHLAAEFALHIDTLSAMNPGSGNRNVWPIDQQRLLFGLLGEVEASIGVHLTDSYLMIPNKTVSGILFPSSVPFVSCQLCTRQRCPLRRAAFTGITEPAGH